MIRTLGILGTGHLSGFVCKGLRGADWPGRLIVSPHSPAKAGDFEAHHGATIAADAQGVIDASDAVLVAVRPDQAEAALSGLRWNGTILLSAMAGVKRAALEILAPDAVVLRAMPISAATLQASPTPLWPAHKATVALLDHVGTVLPMPDEAAFEAATVNAAAYGWYFRLIDTMVAANEAAGLPPDAAKASALATLDAAVTVARAEDRTGAAIFETLATPGGITAQGDAVLRARGAYAPWSEAFAAIAARVKGD